MHFPGWIKIGIHGEEAIGFFQGKELLHVLHWETTCDPYVYVPQGDMVDHVPCGTKLYLVSFMI